MAGKVENCTQTDTILVQRDHRRAMPVCLHAVHGALVPRRAEYALGKVVSRQLRVQRRDMRSHQRQKHDWSGGGGESGTVVSG